MAENKNCNKILIRNASVPIRTCKSIEKSSNLKKVHFSDDVLSSKAGSKIFAIPEFCTLLQLADEMKAVRNTQCSSRSVPDVSKYKNLNFLPDEKIYQNLIGVDVPEEEFVSEIRNHPCVKIKKDPELDFEKYTKCDLHCEYFFVSYAAPSLKTEKTVLNGHFANSKPTF